MASAIAATPPATAIAPTATQNQVLRVSGWASLLTAAEALAATMGGPFGWVVARGTVSTGLGVGTAAGGSGRGIDVAPGEGAAVVPTSRPRPGAGTGAGGDAPVGEGAAGAAACRCSSSICFFRVATWLRASSALEKSG